MKFNWDDRELKKAVEDGVKKDLEKAAIELTADIKKSMDPGTSGYKRYKKTKRKGVYHWSSEPGTPPHVDTGRYRGSFSYVRSWDQQTKGVDNPATAKDGLQGIVSELDKIKVAVGTNMEIGPWLELGTYKMAPRPHIRPAFERLIALRDKIFNRANYKRLNI